MPKDYTALAAKVATKIAHFGDDVSLLKKSRTPSNPAEPWLGTSDVNERIDNVPAVFVPLYGSREVSKAFADAAGATIRTSDSFLIAAIAGVDVTSFQRVVKGDQTWGIVEVHPIAPGDTVLMYQIEVAG